MVFRTACSWGTLIVVSLLVTDAAASRAEAQSSGAEVDVCALLPREEAWKILGQTMTTLRRANKTAKVAGGGTDLQVPRTRGNCHDQRRHR